MENYSGNDSSCPGSHRADAGRAVRTRSRESELLHKLQPETCTASVVHSALIPQEVDEQSSSNGRK